ncbi:hypothetical protein [Clostridium butyricum]|uniref:hypothetical protein n=1 Tax=Clostridium butyricum TaxID=1492 RepID=UPI0011DCB6FE|nr:hypothetical protein [Clostridium butyricum]
MDEKFYRFEIYKSHIIDKIINEKIEKKIMEIKLIDNRKVDILNIVTDKLVLAETHSKKSGSVHLHNLYLKDHIDLAKNKYFVWLYIVSFDLSKKGINEIIDLSKNKNVRVIVVKITDENDRLGNPQIVYDNCNFNRNDNVLKINDILEFTQRNPLLDKLQEFFAKDYILNIPSFYNYKSHKSNNGKIANELRFSIIRDGLYISLDVNKVALKGSEEYEKKLILDKISRWKYKKNGDYLFIDIKGLYKWEAKITNFIPTKQLDELIPIVQQTYDLLMLIKKNGEF